MIQGNISFTTPCICENGKKQIIIFLLSLKISFVISKETIRMKFHTIFLRDKCINAKPYFKENGENLKLSDCILMKISHSM